MALLWHGLAFFALAFFALPTATPAVDALRAAWARHAAETGGVQGECSPGPRLLLRAGRWNRRPMGWHTFPRRFKAQLEDRPGLSPGRLLHSRLSGMAMPSLSHCSHEVFRTGALFELSAGCQWCACLPRARTCASDEKCSIPEVTENISCLSVPMQRGSSAKETRLLASKSSASSGQIQPAGPGPSRLVAPAFISLLTTSASRPRNSASLPMTSAASMF